MIYRGGNYKTREIVKEMAAELFPVSDLSPQFLNASWADIVEAEELEDFDAIEKLRYSSGGCEFVCERY